LSDSRTPGVQDLLHCAYCRSLSKHAKPGSLQHRLSRQSRHLAEQACVVVVRVGGFVVEVVVALVVLAACVVIGVVVG